MKLLIISAGVHPVPPVNGGAVENLIDFYLKDSKNNNTEVLSIYDDKLESYEYKYNNCKFHFIKKNAIHDFFTLYSEKILRRLFGIYYGTPYIRKVCSYIRKEEKDYDMIVVENMPQYGPMIKKVSNSKLVLHLHNDYLNIDSFKNKENYSSYDKILCVSDFISDRVRAVGNTNDNKVFTLYNGIDLERFYNNSKSNDDIFAKYKIEKNKFNIIYSGRVCPEKGVENLIDAFNMMNDSTLQLIILGGYNYGTSKDNDFITNLKKKSLEKNVVFTGYVNYDDINYLYAIADLGVIPSIVNEACPLTAIEMMASGIPVICTNSGGLPELIDDKCGIIVDRTNLTQNLNQAIKKVYDNKELLENYSQNAKIRSQNFSREQYVANFWKYLEKFNKE